jgi:membrane protease YdiL (CAAX protease family)
MAPPQLGQIVWGTLSGVLLLILTLLVLRHQGRRAEDVGLRFSVGSAKRFLIGGAIGFAVYGCTIGLDAALAVSIRFTRVSATNGGAVLLAVATFLMLSVMEELGFRGYTLQTLVSAAGVWTAQVVVAVAFALSHILFGWSWQTIALGVLPSAFLFGAAAVAFGDIAAPIGLHAALNIARWSTGEQNTPGIWTMSVDDHARGRWAVLAPVIAIAVTAATTLLLWWWGRRHARHDAAKCN